MSIVVTGAGGMIGSHLAEILHGLGETVIGLYYKPTVDLQEIKKGICLLECDVRYSQHVQKIISEYRPTQIYHLAAQSYPAVSWERPYETMDINAGGTISIFEAVKHARTLHHDYDPIVVVACSSAEYGAAFEKLAEPKIRETAELLPLHPYGVSKVAQDLLAYQYFANDKIKTIRARIFNTTGTRKVNDVASDFTKRAVEQEKTNTKPSILRVGNIETYRAILDVRDLINALILLAEKGRYGDVYNISAEKAIQIKEIIQVIEKITGMTFDLQIDTSLLRPSDERIIIGNTEKLVEDTGWHPAVPLEETLSDMLCWWRSKP